MESFRWDSCFVTGLPTVDEQHHHLVDVINRFGDLLMQSAAPSPEKVEQVFGELTNYAEYHFREEETLMERSQIDPRHFAQHCTEHARFLQEVSAMHAAMSGDHPDQARALLNFLTHWLAYHILGQDRMMARLISASAAGKTVDDARLTPQEVGDPATAALLHALNCLFEQVSERGRALHELNRTLEARVATRTLELSEANQRLEDMAMTDVLTGLPNRRYAMRYFRHEWQEASSKDTPLACMMIDADHFKVINDTYGHDAGDEVLRQLTQRLRDGMRNDDCLCRLGGDEFLIICANTALSGVLQRAEKLCQEVAGLRVPTGRGEWCGSISIGVAVRDSAMKTVEDLLRVADEGVYVAKRNGRNRVATVARSAAKTPGRWGSDLAPCG